ncbi:unnamed protein product [Adineta steineri]|uniref:Uncharacterized protein n=1 Tax=Adineta steineri TaxID=433720 RepID=A0A814BTW9_9BILA|nr:unnamed protein product [Adineta steineri]CAF3874878.1 unnamed protein product [Adineta steineri]
MSADDIDQLKRAVLNLAEKVPSSVDIEPIKAYYTKLSGTHELTDKQKEIIKARCLRFDALAEKNLCELVNPATMKRLEACSEFVSSDPPPHVTKATAKFYSTFIDILAPKLMECGKNVEKELANLIQNVKQCPLPSTLPTEYECFQLVLLELLNEPMNKVYDFLNEKKESFDKWLTNTNLDQMIAMEYKTRLSNDANKEDTFLTIFRQDLESLAKTYKLETNDFISLLKYKNCRAYDDTRKYAQDIESFVKHCAKQSQPSFTDFLIQYAKISQDHLKNELKNEVNKVTILFQIYCNAISNGNDDEQHQLQAASRRYDYVRMPHPENGTANTEDLVELIFHKFKPRLNFIVRQTEGNGYKNAEANEIGETMLLVTNFLGNRPEYDDHVVRIIKFASEESLRGQ